MIWSALTGECYAFRHRHEHLIFSFPHTHSCVDQRTTTYVILDFSNFENFKYFSSSNSRPDSKSVFTTTSLRRDFRNYPMFCMFPLFFGSKVTRPWYVSYHHEVHKLTHILHLSYRGMFQQLPLPVKVTTPGYVSYQACSVSTTKITLVKVIRPRLRQLSTRRCVNNQTIYT